MKERSGFLFRFRFAIALAVSLLAAYSLAYDGRILGSGDEIIRYLMMDNLCQGRGFLAEYADRDGALRVYGSQRIPKFGFLHPLLAAPLRLLSCAGHDPSRFAESDLQSADGVPVHRRAVGFVLWLNPLAAALLGVAFYHCGRTLGYSQRCCYVAALMLGLCTIVLAYTPLFFTEIVSAFFLMLAYGMALQRGGSKVWLCGLFAGLLVSNNALFLFALPVLALYVMWGVRGGGRGLVLGLFSLGCAVGLSLFFLGLAARGSSGYEKELGFITPLAVGLFGLLLSPGKSFFLFSPIALLGAVGFRTLLRSHRGPAILALCLAVPQLLIYAKWCNWAGGTCWGPRFLIPAVPLVMLGMFPLLSAAHTRGRLAVGFVGSVALLSFVVQFSATFAPAYAWFHYASSRLNVQMGDNRFAQRGIDDPLLVFQTSVPYFPEYCPPYHQLRAFGEILRQGDLEAIPAKWVREKRIVWGLAALGTILGCSIWVLRGNGRERSDCERQPRRETSQ